MQGGYCSTSWSGTGLAVTEKRVSALAVTFLTFVDFMHVHEPKWNHLKCLRCWWLLWHKQVTKPQPQSPRLVYPIVDTSGFEGVCCWIFGKNPKNQEHDTSLQTFGYNWCLIEQRKCSQGFINHKSMWIERLHSLFWWSTLRLKLQVFPHSFILQASFIM